MSIGSIDTEAALAAFVQKQIEQSRVAVVARQQQGGLPVVTALPSPPEDGQEVLYRFAQTVVPADAGVLMWRLRYDAASGAWLPVGRQEPVYAFRGTVELVNNTVGALVWFAVNANDPRVTAPLAGDYILEWGCGIVLVGSAVSTLVGLNVAGIGNPPAALPVAGTDSGFAVSGPQTNLTWDKSGVGRRKVTLAAGGTATQVYLMNAATGNFWRGEAFVKLFPRRITG